MQCSPTQHVDRLAERRHLGHRPHLYVSLTATPHSGPAAVPGTCTPAIGTTCSHRRCHPTQLHLLPHSTPTDHHRRYLSNPSGAASTLSPLLFQCFGSSIIHVSHCTSEFSLSSGSKALPSPEPPDSELIMHVPSTSLPHDPHRSTALGKHPARAEASTCCSLALLRGSDAHSDVPRRRREHGYCRTTFSAQLEETEWMRRSTDYGTRT